MDRIQVTQWLRVAGSTSRAISSGKTQICDIEASKNRSLSFSESQVSTSRLMMKMT